MDFLLLPVRFVIWYCTVLPLRLLRFFLNSTIYLEDSFAIRLHTKLFFIPLFHDTSIVGRLMGMIFRLTRIFTGLIVITLYDVFLAPIFIAWLILPFLPLFVFPTIWIWPVLFVVYCFVIFGRPTRLVTSKTTVKDINNVADLQTARLLVLAQKDSKAFLKKYCKTKAGRIFFYKMDCHLDQLTKQIAELAMSDTQRTFSVTTTALAIAKQEKARHLEGRHIVVALTSKDSPVAPMLEKIGLSQKIVAETSRWMTQEDQHVAVPQLWEDDYYKHHLGGVNRGWMATPTPVLDAISTDLTQAAAKGLLKKPVGRKDVVGSVIQILTRAGKENVLLVGEAGVGKQSIVEHLAYVIIDGDAPKSLFSRRVVAVDSGALVANTGMQGALEAKMNAVMTEIEKAGNIILYLPDLQALLEMSSQLGNIDLFSYLRPYLTSNRFQVIAAATTEQYQRFIEPKSEFVSQFQIVDIPEMTAQDAVMILETEAPVFEKRHQVVVSLPAILTAVELTERYVHDRVLPGKALDVIDEACVLVAGMQAHGIVGKRHVEHVVEQKTHVPVHNATKHERDVLLNLEAELHKRFVSQDQAVAGVANALRRARAGVHITNRPMASFLFVGPTGVGKTELAKALADVYFGSEDAMVRFDMSEFQEPLSIYRLIGSPASGTGMPQPGQLTEVIRQKPFALLLFDEIEKANKSILDLFLQILDDGRLTDSNGHTVSFQDAIIICTTNAATPAIEEAIAQGQTPEMMESNLTAMLNQYFRIEFINRFDGTILFQPLTPADMVSITRLMLDQLRAELHKRGFEVSFPEEVVVLLAQSGYNPSLGARPLRRLIQDKIEGTIAKMILANQLVKGQPVLLGPQYFS